jgi:vacuolar-type H+-ATPase subunit I/STV1
MAVSKVKKLELIAHTQCREEILEALREMGSVHISDIRELMPDIEPELPDFIRVSLSQTQSKLDRVLYCSLFLERFLPKPSLIEKLFKGKLVFTKREVEDCLSTFDLDGLYEE